MTDGRRNGILRQIDLALRADDTPRWAVPILLCLRDDHTLLHNHIAAHERYAAPLRQIAVSVLTTLLILAMSWLLFARFA